MERERDLEADLAAERETRLARPLPAHRERDRLGVAAEDLREEAVALAEVEHEHGRVERGFDDRLEIGDRPDDLDGSVDLASSRRVESAEPMSTQAGDGCATIAALRSIEVPPGLLAKSTPVGRTRCAARRRCPACP